VKPRTRAGIVLPFVLIALVAASIITLGFVTSVWRGARAVQHTLALQASTAATDDALASAAAQWSGDSLWVDSIGTVRRRTHLTAAGEQVTLTLWRTHALSAWIRVSLQRGDSARHLRVQRDALRVFWLAPPALPLSGAFTADGTVQGSDATFISGVDVGSVHSACGAQRDSADVTALVAAGAMAMPGRSWPSAPVHQPVGATTVTAAVQAVTTTLASRSRHVVRDSSAQRLMLSPGWHALSLDAAPGSTTLTISGPSAWRGMLIVNGDLHVTGAFDVEGVLLVRGALVVHDAPLRVRGAVIAAGTQPLAASLGNATVVTYDRCAVQLALATVAVPTVKPFSTWNELAH
jgi:hypothetical protein